MSKFFKMFWLSGERCIDGPLEQVVLREFDALDELKDWIEECIFFKVLDCWTFNDIYCKMFKYAKVFAT